MQMRIVRFSMERELEDMVGELLRVSSQMCNLGDVQHIHIILVVCICNK